MNRITLGIICVAILSVGSVFAGNLVITGSTTVLPIAQAAAEEFMKSNPDVNISVSGGGSGNGIKSIIDSTCDIATSSRFVKDKEVTMACEKNVLMVPHRVASLAPPRLPGSRPDPWHMRHTAAQPPHTRRGRSASPEGLLAQNPKSHSIGPAPTPVGRAPQRPPQTSTPRPPS